MKILAIFAHPDDESYGPAGTLAMAVKEGHTVSLLTMTRGESGTLGVSKDLSASDMAELRCRELQNAVQKLGIQKLRILDFPDKQLKDVPEPYGVARIKNEIIQFKPDTIITYHENTISGHPDHRAVTHWISMVLKTIPNSPKLFHYGLNLIQTSIMHYADLIPIKESDITHKIDIREALQKKIDAIQCHKTQMSIWNEAVEHQVDMEGFFQFEHFVQKWPVLKKNKIKTELFRD